MEDNSIKEKLRDDLLFNRFVVEVRKIVERINKEIAHVENPLYVYFSPTPVKWIGIYTKKKCRRNVKIYIYFSDEVDYLEKVKISKYQPYTFYKVACFFLIDEEDIEELKEIIFWDYYNQINYYLKEDLKKSNSRRTATSIINC